MPCRLVRSKTQRAVTLTAETFNNFVCRNRFTVNNLNHQVLRNRLAPRAICRRVVLRVCTQLTQRTLDYIVFARRWRSTPLSEKPGRNPKHATHTFTYPITAHA